ncbi:unnamed protein product [Ixodes hexagonus]
MGVRSRKPGLRKRAYSSDRQAILAARTSYKLPLSVAARTCAPCPQPPPSRVELADGNGRSKPDAPKASFVFFLQQAPELSPGNSELRTPQQRQ